MAVENAFIDFVSVFFAGFVVVVISGFIFEKLFPGVLGKVAHKIFEKKKKEEERINAFSYKKRE